MLKQFLSRFPRKSSSSSLSKADSVDSTGNNSGNNTNNGGGGGGNGIQRTNSVNAVSGRSNVVKRMSSAVFPSSVVAGIEPLQSFKDVPNQEKQNLLLSMLNLCCVVFDFNDPNKNFVEKDLKRQTLIELVDFVASGSSRFTEPVIAAICKMSSVNLFRVFPPNYRSNSPTGGGGGGENEDDEPMFDPP